MEQTTQTCKKKKGDGCLALHASHRDVVGWMLTGEGTSKRGKKESTTTTMDTVAISSAALIHHLRLETTRT